MDAATHALCYFYRNPKSGGKALSFTKIAQLVKKIDGDHPTKDAVRKAVLNFGKKRKPRGRKLGWRKTTKTDDAKILKTFKRLRPSGQGVDSRIVQSSLPKKLSMKVCRRTIIRRLNEKGYKYSRKIAKSDTGPAHLHSQRSTKARVRMIGPCSCRLWIL